MKSILAEIKVCVNFVLILVIQHHMKEFPRNTVTLHSPPSQESVPPQTPEHQLLVHSLGIRNCPEVLSFSPNPCLLLLSLPCTPRDQGLKPLATTNFLMYKIITYKIKTSLKVTPKSHWHRNDHMIQKEGRKHFRDLF